ncbi:hypothetical protein OsI_15549 [Oryza sativa Indica Group]|nr:hypothetical protein OsI_15549 [Oryza sativa Indica Group]
MGCRLQRRPALHRSRQLSLPDGQRGDPAVQQAIEEEEIQVRAGAHGENSQGRRRQQEDGDGTSGVSLSKDLIAVAGNALKMNITTLCPLVLPLSEQLLH